MTTIAYRDGALAADTATTFASGKMNDVPKIIRSGDMLAAASGDAGYCYKFLRWVQSGCYGNPPEARSDNDGSDHGLIVRVTEQEHFEASGSFKSAAKYIAIGSGGRYAMGAMCVGASAEDAVRAGIAHDPYSGGDVTVLRLGDQT